jgi:hypothetical protein
MENAIHTAHSAECRFQIAHVSCDQFDLIQHLLEVRSLSGAEVVQDTHAVAALYQGFHQVGTDESRSTGYETNRHETTLKVARRRPWVKRERPRHAKFHRAGLKKRVFREALTTAAKKMPKGGFSSGC